MQFKDTHSAERVHAAPFACPGAQCIVASQKEPAPH
jgi:hypothetical protein